MIVTNYTENTFECLHNGRECKVERACDGRFYITVLDTETGMHDYEGVYDAVNGGMVDAINNMICESELFEQET